MPKQSQARSLRKKATWAEKRLWALLRSRRLAGYKFRRQYAAGPYHLDFYCIEAGVAVESDGFGHGHPAARKQDQERDAYLARKGILVKRIWNSQLAKPDERESFVESLWRLLQERSLHPENRAPPSYRRAPDRLRDEREESPSP